MRVILFLNNWGGWQVAQWLRECGDEIVGLVVQPELDQRYAAEYVMPSGCRRTRSGAPRNSETARSSTPYVARRPRSASRRGSAMC